MMGRNAHGFSIPTWKGQTMKNAIGLPAVFAASLISVSLACQAQDGAAAAIIGGGASLHSQDKAGAAKSVSTAVLGSRGTVTPSVTLFGGFAISAAADVYILVRGNSLGTLGVTQGFLDAPRVRLYTASGQDMLVDTFGRAGFNGCVSGSNFTDPVVNYYTNVRGQPPHARDGCVALHMQAGNYSFTVTPSIVGVTTTSGTSSPSSGEVLFEVSFNP
jgi:hypothetical protein